MVAEFSRDILTDLPNLIGLIKDMSRLPSEGGALIGFDVKGLTDVNEEYGEAVGNQVIVAVAKSLRAVCATYESRAFAYRLAGDEFALSLSGADRSQAASAATAVAERFATTIATENLPPVCFVNTIVLYPDEAANLASLLIRLHLRLIKSGQDCEAEPPPAWVESLFTHLIRRFDETMDELRRTQHLAVTDAITGLPNHRAGEQALTTQIAASSRDGDIFTLLFVDGDNLKEYNDTFGYEAGNSMIRNMGRILTDNVRPQDSVFRWLSGDEFLVILPQTSRAEALIVAERLRGFVENQFARRPIPVTVSIGVATFPEDGIDPDQLIERVTLANILAKQAGRNRIHIAGSSVM